MKEDSKLSLSFETYNTSAASGDTRLYITYNGQTIAPSDVSYETSYISVNRERDCLYIYWSTNYSTTNQATRSITITYKGKSATAYVIQDVNSIVSTRIERSINNFSSNDHIYGLSLVSDHRYGDTYTWEYEGDSVDTEISCNIQQYKVTTFATGDTQSVEYGASYNEVIRGWHGYLYITTNEYNNNCDINCDIYPIDGEGGYISFSSSWGPYDGDERYLNELVDGLYFSSSLLSSVWQDSSCATVSVNGDEADIYVYSAP